MAVVVRFFSLLKLELGKSRAEYEFEERVTVRELIKQLDEDFNGEFGRRLLRENELKTGAMILLNGRNILHLDGLQTLIDDEARVTIIPPSAGG